MLPTRPYLLATALALCGCTPPAALPVCPDDPKVYGDCVFLRAEGRRQDARDVVLDFQLRIKRNERFTATPRIDTFLGEVVELQSGGGNITTTIRMPRPEPLTATMLVRGSVSADFVEQNDQTRTLDRCAYEQEFTVRVNDPNSSEEGVVITQNFDSDCGGIPCNGCP